MPDLRARLARPTLLLTALLLASCGDDETTDPGPDVSSLDVSPASAQVTVGHTAQLTATPKDGAGNAVSDVTVDFTSSDTGVATVTGAGVVTGVAPGTATLTATVAEVAGVSGSAGVTVLASDPTALVVTSLGAAVAGRQFAVVAEVQDVLGNPVLGFSGPVTVAMGSDPSRGGGVPAAMLWGTTTVDAVAGVATFGDLSLNLAASPYTLALSALSGGLTVESAQFAVASALVDLAMSPTAALIPFVSAADDSEEVVGANALDYHWFGARSTAPGISVGNNGA
ncbi:MAG: Ig-like domain-containing protein, partial [Candidatus Eiseniibacteriota bacterium]